MGTIALFQTSQFMRRVMLSRYGKNLGDDLLNEKSVPIVVSMLFVYKYLPVVRKKVYSVKADNSGKCRPNVAWAWYVTSQNLCLCYYNGEFYFLRNISQKNLEEERVDSLSDPRRENVWLRKPGDEALYSFMEECCGHVLSTEVDDDKKEKLPGLSYFQNKDGKVFVLENGKPVEKEVSEVYR